jgi:hypothetical protein
MKKGLFYSGPGSEAYSTPRQSHDAMRYSLVSQKLEAGMAATVRHVLAYPQAICICSFIRHEHAYGSFLRSAPRKDKRGVNLIPMCCHSASLI